jgi:hypothetical protein
LTDLVRLLNKFILKNELKGYYIRVKGRFKRGRRKAILIRKKGLIAFNSLHLRLHSCFGLLYTRFGIAGLKIIFSY